MNANAFPPGPYRAIDGVHDHRSTRRLLVQRTAVANTRTTSAVPMRSPATERSTARRPINSAGTGSGDCLATPSGAHERLIPLIDRLMYPTTTELTSVITHVAVRVPLAVLRRVPAKPVIELG